MVGCGPGAARKGEWKGWLGLVVVKGLGILRHG